MKKHKFQLVAYSLLFGVGVIALFIYVSWDRESESTNKQPPPTQQTTLNGGPVSDRTNLAGSDVQAKDSDKIKVQSNSQDNLRGQPLKSKHVPYKLFELEIGDNKQDVFRLHGESDSEYLTDDGGVSLLELDYQDFLVGFDSNDRVQYINVTGEEAEPGLGGLKIGSLVSDVVRILGQPDRAGTFVKTYSKQGAMLKIDLDPQSKTVTSIKLFAE